MNDLELSKQELQTDPVKLRKHLETLEAASKLAWADEFPDMMRDLSTQVKDAHDPELTLKFVKFVSDHIGWGPAAKKVDNPTDRLPMFNFVLNGSAVQVQTVDPNTNEVTDVFDMGSFSPTQLQLATSGVNADLGDLDV